jgi:hypothetical protein
MPMSFFAADSETLHSAVVAPQPVRVGYRQSGKTSGAASDGTKWKYRQSDVVVLMKGVASGVVFRPC